LALTMAGRFRSPSFLFFNELERRGSTPVPHHRSETGGIHALNKALRHEAGKNPSSSG